MQLAPIPYLLNQASRSPAPSFLFSPEDLGDGEASLVLVPAAGIESVTATFTRATAATTVLSNGLIGSVASGVPRSYYDPSSFTTNLLLHSESFDNAVWTKEASTISPDLDHSPDGGVVADKLVENTDNTDHFVYLGISKPSAALTYTASVYCKPAGRNRVTLFGWNNLATGRSNATFDLTGAGQAADVQNAGTFSGAVASIEAVGNGYYRCVLTFTSDTATGVLFQIRLDNGSGAEAFSTSYLGDGTSGAYIWGAQLERASTAGPYVSTTTAARSDFGTYLGYLAEGARTNLCLQSEVLGTTWGAFRVTVSANQIAAPDGATTADKIAEDNTAANSHVLVQSVTLSGATVYTFSTFAKAAERTWMRLGWNDGAGNQAAWFNLATGEIGTQESGVTATILAYPNGWYRCSVTITSDAVPSSPIVFICPSPADNTSTYDGVTGNGIYAWGAQLEAAEFASSYIPTTTAAVVRNADTLKYPTTGWLNAISGSVLANFRLPSPSAVATSSPRIWTLDDGTTNNHIGVLVPAVYAAQLFGVVSGAAVISPSTNAGTVVVGTDHAVAAAWEEDDFIVVLDDQTSAPDTAGGVPVVDTLEIGALIDGQQPFGPIRRVAYYPSRLPNAMLQILTGN